MMEAHGLHPADFHAPALQDGPNRDESAPDWTCLGVEMPLRDEVVHGLMTCENNKVGKKPENEVEHALCDCVQRDESYLPYKNQGFGEENVARNGSTSWRRLKWCAAPRVPSPDHCSEMLDKRWQWNGCQSMLEDEQVAKENRCPGAAVQLQLEDGKKKGDQDTEEAWLMQKSKQQKRRRSPTPRRRRIPARGRVSFEPSQRQYRRASWMRTPEEPTCSSSWAGAPWRRPKPTREPSRPSRASEPEDDREQDEEPAIDLTASSLYLPCTPPLPPFEEGIRTWGELIGILDPMDEAEQIIDPLVVRNGVDRIRRMGTEERSELNLQLVRFLTILYAEILRMLQMVDQDDGTSLLQLPKMVEKSQYANVPNAERWELYERDAIEDFMEDSVSFMQTGVDRFGVLLQKLLGLMEKMGQPQASLRARFLLSVLADIQRPGPHISAVVVEKMDRLQALLLSFDEGENQDTSDEDRDWCLRQWEILRLTLLDRKRERSESDQEQVHPAASSSDIVCIEDSQESIQEGGTQMAILSDGSTRPLTVEEMAEIAYNEELERSAAEMESRADEQRWLEYRARCLQDEGMQPCRKPLTPTVTRRPARAKRLGSWCKSRVRVAESSDLKCSTWWSRMVRPLRIRLWFFLAMTQKFSSSEGSRRYVMDNKG